MTIMHKVIIVLTGLLFLVGSVLLLSGNVDLFGGGSTFDTETSYEEARGGGGLPSDAPDMPACARDIEITGGAETQSISFLCDDRREREQFVAYVKNGFAWNVFVYEGNRVVLERPKKD